MHSHHSELPFSSRIKTFSHKKQHGYIKVTSYNIYANIWWIEREHSTASLHCLDVETIKQEANNNINHHHHHHQRTSFVLQHEMSDNCWMNRDACHNHTLSPADESQLLPCPCEFSKNSPIGWRFLLAGGYSISSFINVHGAQRMSLTVMISWLLQHH